MAHEHLQIQLPDPAYIDEQTYRKGRNRLLGLMVVGWLGSIAGLVQNPGHFYSSYLTAFVYWVTIAVGALFFVMVQHLGSAAWSVPLRRQAENWMITLPGIIVLALPVVVGLHSLYEWTHVEVVQADHILMEKAAWLNEPLFIARSLLYFGLWSLFAWKLFKLSAEQDQVIDPQKILDAKKWSGVGLLLLTLTVTHWSFEWLMSLDPHWYSTIFGLYIYAGGGVAFVALLIVVLILLQRCGILARSVTLEHYHDLGKLLFAFTVFWAYLAYSQYMLIWYGNLPEEIEWFIARKAEGWRPLFLALIFGHFLIPFLVLIGRAAKRNLKILGAAAAWTLIIHYVDLYWVVMPTFYEHGPAWHWLDLSTYLALGATFAFIYWIRARSVAVAPIGDVRLPEALSYHNL